MAGKKTTQRKLISTSGAGSEGARARHLAFIEAYLTVGPNYRNGTKAAIAAGYSAPTAAQQAHRLLKDVQIRAEITAREIEIVTKAQERTQLSVEDVLRSLARAVKVDPRRFFNKNGTLKKVSELSDDEAMALEGFEVETRKNGKSVIVGYKLASRTTAREQALKHLGLIKVDPLPPADVNVTVTLKVPDIGPLKAAFSKRLQPGAKP